MGDEGIERAVLMMRRAEVPQARMRLGSDVLGKCHREPRLADAGLPGDQHHPSFATLHLLPASDKQFDILLTTDKRRVSRAQGLEAAQHPALGEHPPALLP